MDTVINPASQSRRYHAFGWAVCLASAIFFSSKAIAIKLAYQHGVDAANLLALRMAMALPIYLVLAVIYWRKTNVRQRTVSTQLAPKVIAVGLMGYYLASLFDFMGLSYVSAQLERIVLFSYPLLVVILGALFFAQPLKKPVLVALPLCWLGIMVSMFGDWQGVGSNVLLGAGLILLSALTYALYTLMAKKMIHAMGGGLFTSVAMASAAIGSVLHVTLSQGGASFFGWSSEVYWYALYMAVFATVIPSYLFSEAVKRLGSDLAATSSSVGPVATSVMAVMILGEPFGVWQALGMGLVLASVAWLSRKA